MSLITRQDKGSRLTVEEMDGNFTFLRGSYKETTNTSIDWSESTIQKFNLTEDVVFDFTGAVAGQKLTLLLNQSSGNVGWTSSVKWVNDVVPVITSGIKLDTSFVTGSGFNGDVRSITLQSDGKILVGGYFTEYNGVSVGRLVRLNSDGSLDTTFVTGTGFNSGVFAISLQSDGKVLVVGNFDQYNGQLIGYGIARLNSDGSLDTTFITGTGFNNYVYPVVLQSDGKILVGGTFDSYDGQSIGHIARLNSNGTLDTTFVTGTGFNEEVSSITLQSDGKILVGGFFTEYDGQSIGYIARLNSNGTLDTTFVTGTGFNNFITKFGLQSDGKILVGGGFDQYNGQLIGTGITRLNSDGSLDTTFDTGTGFNDYPREIISKSDGKILVGGQFWEYDGQSIGYGIARLNSDGSLDTTFVTGTGFNSDVYSVVLQSDGKILVGGDFNNYNGQSIGSSVAILSQLPTYKVINLYFNGVNYIGESINQI